jgi:PTH1 family peptidyl-tRNA hydrolase
MNVSGPTLVKAYKAWLAREGLTFPSPSSPSQCEVGRLFVIHDELQAPLGKLQLRRGGTEVSNRGHNGLKSVVASLGKAGMLGVGSLREGPGGKKVGSNTGMPAEGKAPHLLSSTILVRVGIGIGRPEGRDSETVSEYVLQEMSPFQYKKTCAQAGLLAALLEREVLLDS